MKNATWRVIQVEPDMRLHIARVTDTIVDGTDREVTARFLRNNAKDSADIGAGRGADVLNGSIDGVDFAGTLMEGHEGGVLNESVL